MADGNIVTQAYRTHNVSITTKFGFGFGILLILIVLVAVTGYFSLILVHDSVNSIQKSMEIERLVLEMDRGMEKARRLHGDFFLQYPRIGLKNAHELYAQPSVRQIAKTISLSNRLKMLIQSKAVSESMSKHHVDLNIYLSAAKRFADTSIQSVELVTELAAPERGLEAKFERHLTELSDKIADNKDLKLLFYEIKMFTQNYRLNRKRFIMQSAFNKIFEFREQLTLAKSFDAKQIKNIDNILRKIEKDAQKILDVDSALKANFNDFSLQDKNVRPMSDALTAMARKDVIKANQRISKTHLLATVFIGVISLMGLLAAAVIVRMLNKGITRRVIDLTEAAGELRKGNVHIQVPETPMDELGQLARTFNIMSDRIRKLVDKLEQKVEQQTVQLAASERRYHELFEHLRSGVVVYEAIENGNDFIFKDINQAVESIEGITREDVIGQRVTKVFPGVIEFGFFNVLQTVFKTGVSIHLPTSPYNDGKVNGWRENSVYKLPSGEIVAVYDDRTAQKQAEIEKINMSVQLRRAKKMEAIGLMAGGVAHDLNNILAGIVGYPELMLLEIEPDSPLRESIEAIRDSGKRAAAVVADLLTISRNVANVKNISNLNGLVNEYLSSPEGRKLRSTYAYIDCKTELATELSNISCSSIHIKKCIMNLMINAMEAIDGPGRIVITTYNQNVDKSMADKHAITPGPYVVLSIKDNGRGIPEKDMEHIFEPFYTKKVMGRSGTGLGLAVVWNTMQEHEGTVAVESSTSGTTFWLLFPASTQAITNQTIMTEIEEMYGNGETILVVDDEPAMRDLAKRILLKLGYKVICQDSGEAAIAYIRNHPVDLVVIDMIMEPGINGRQTYEQICSIIPGQKAIIASGFSENEAVKKALELGAQAFIRKPYTIDQLGVVVKQTLNHS